MQKEFLLDLINQNKVTSLSILDNITPENAALRLNEDAASVGFIYRHIGETLNMFGLFFGIPSDIKNTTMGQQDTGQGKHIAESAALINQGFQMLLTLVEQTKSDEWSDLIDTPFFGKVSRARLFAHVLYHNSHHAGQISLTLKRGKLL